jgi:hypothetical protein
MRQEFSKLVDRIRERFPRLDVRTDQCDIVRVITKGVLVGIRQEGDEFKAEFISLEDEGDLDTTVTKTVTSTDLAAFEEAVLESLVHI